MENILNDTEYLNIVSDILNNSKYNIIRYSDHHGLSRLDHCIRVSYYSYVWAKKLKLNEIACARAGLLHDFFTNEELNPVERRTYAFIHHKKALANAKKYYELSKLEEDIIISHMFPMVINKLPLHKESWLVTMVDKIIATYEWYLIPKTYVKNTYHNYASYIMLFMIFVSRLNNL